MISRLHQDFDSGIGVFLVNQHHRQLARKIIQIAKKMNESAVMENVPHHESATRAKFQIGMSRQMHTHILHNLSLLTGIRFWSNITPKLISLFKKKFPKTV